MYLGIDYGKKRIGVAVGSVIPKPLKPIFNTGDVLVIDKICQICQEYEIETIVIGMPFRSQGEEGTISKEIRKFADDLEKCNLPIEFEPEQFSTVEAEEMLKRQGKKLERSGLTDSVSAAIILEQFIAGKKQEK